MTSIITGYWALRLIFLPVDGEPQSWWPAIMLGASILLLSTGIHAVVPKIRGVWLVLLAAVLPLVLFAVLFRALPLRWWFFAFAVALSMGITQVLASALERAEYLVPVTSLILAVSWVPVSVNTLRGYFSPTSSSPDPWVLYSLLALWVLILESVVVGFLFCKSPRSGER